MKINSLPELESGIETLAISEAKRMKIRSKYEVQINDLKKAAEKDTRDLDARCAGIESAIERYCLRNRSNFEATNKFPFGTLTFKANPEKIDYLPGWDEEKSVEAALRLKREAIVTTHRLNKDYLKMLTIAALAKIGLCKVQGETFKIKVKKIVLEEV